VATRARLWHLSLKDETIGGKYKLKKEQHRKKFYFWSFRWHASRPGGLWAEIPTRSTLKFSAAPQKKRGARPVNA